MIKKKKSHRGRRSQEKHEEDGPPMFVPFKVKVDKIHVYLVIAHTRLIVKD